MDRMVKWFLFFYFICALKNWKMQNCKMSNEELLLLLNFIMNKFAFIIIFCYYVRLSIQLCVHAHFQTFVENDVWRTGTVARTFIFSLNFHFLQKPMQYNVLICFWFGIFVCILFSICITRSLFVSHLSYLAIQRIEMCSFQLNWMNFNCTVRLDRV